MFKFQKIFKFCSMAGLFFLFGFSEIESNNTVNCKSKITEYSQGPNGRIIKKIVCKDQNPSEGDINQVVQAVNNDLSSINQATLAPSPENCLTLQAEAPVSIPEEKAKRPVAALLKQADEAISQEKYENALSFVSRAIRIQPQYSFLYYKLGLIHQEVASRNLTLTDKIQDRSTLAKELFKKAALTAKRPEDKEKYKLLAEGN